MLYLTHNERTRPDHQLLHGRVLEHDDSADIRREVEDHSQGDGRLLPRQQGDVLGAVEVVVRHPRFLARAPLVFLHALEEGAKQKKTQLHHSAHTCTARHSRGNGLSDEGGGANEGRCSSVVVVGGGVDHVDGF